MDPIATTALVVSLIALITTTLQVIQQYLASASDGFRRCKPSVMGLWAKSTRRYFRFDELGFEVVFEVPVIFLASPENKRGPIPQRKIHIIDGSNASYDATNILQPSRGGPGVSVTRSSDVELASWVILLGMIQREEADSIQWEKRDWETSQWVGQESALTHQPFKRPQYTLIHAIEKKVVSWDFMPPGTTRPYTSTTLSHLVEMVALLGMHWKSFDVSLGELRAEGNDVLCTSSLIPGLGTVTTFSHAGLSDFGENRVIPNLSIKEWAFGSVPSIVGTLALGKNSLGQTLRSLGGDVDAFTPFGLGQDTTSHSIVFELIGMLGKTVRIRGSSFKRLPNPTNIEWPEDRVDWKGAMETFQDNLAGYRNESQDPLILAILDQWNKMGPSWSNIELSWRAGYPRTELREIIYSAIHSTDDSLRSFTRDAILQVVFYHFSELMSRPDNIFNTTYSRENGGRHSITYYFDSILPSSSNGRFTGFNLPHKQAIWLLLMFRMLCWFLLHDFDHSDINIIPSNLKGSQMPISIG